MGLVWGLAGRYKGCSYCIPFSVSRAEGFLESCWGGLWRSGGGGCLVVFVVLGWFFLCVNVFMGGEGEL